MFLRSKIRRKDGKEHRSWSVVENRRVAGGRVVQRHVLYLGEINSTQERAWRRSIEVMEAGTAQPRTLSLFPEDRCEGLLPDSSIVRLKLSEVRLRRPRQWGACWLALELWRELGLDRFWGERLDRSRKGTRWDQVLFVLVAYRLLAPGSEWRLHREWFERTALADLLGEDFRLAESHKLYRWRLLAIAVAKDSATFSYRLDRGKLRRARRREGRYLLRTNLTDDDSARLWGLYLQLVSVEEAFRNLKGDLAIRPIFHQDQTRVEAHIFIAFLAPARHARPAAACPGAWADTAQRHRKIRRRADDRSACPDDRWPRAAVDPLYRTGARTRAPP